MIIDGLRISKAGFPSSAVLYPPPQIPHGLHMDSINPPGLHLEKTSSYNFA